MNLATAKVKSIEEIAALACCEEFLKLAALDAGKLIQVDLTQTRALEFCMLCGKDHSMFKAVRVVSGERGVFLLFPKGRPNPRKPKKAVA